MKDAILLELAETWELQADTGGDGLNKFEPPARAALRMCADGLRMLVDFSQRSRQHESEWVVVQREPTTAMLIAGNHCQPGDYQASVVWKEMVAASERGRDYQRPPLQDMLATPTAPAQPPSAQGQEGHAFEPRDVSYEIYPRTDCQRTVKSVVCAKCGRHEDHPTHRLSGAQGGGV